MSGLSGAKPWISKKTEEEIFAINGVAGAAIGLGTMGLGGLGFDVAANGTIMAGIATANTAVNLAGKVINGIQPVSADAINLAKHLKKTISHGWNSFKGWLSNDDSDTLGNDAAQASRKHHALRSLMTCLEDLDESLRLDKPVRSTEVREQLRRSAESDQTRIERMNVMDVAEVLERNHRDHGDMLHGSNNRGLAEAMLEPKTMEAVAAETTLEVEAREWGMRIKELCQSGPSTIGPKNMTSTRVFTRAGAFNTDPRSKWEESLNAFRAKFDTANAAGGVNRPPGQAYAVDLTEIESLAPSYFTTHETALELLKEEMYPSVAQDVPDLQATGLHDVGVAKQTIAQDALEAEMQALRLGKGGTMNLEVNASGECSFRITPRGGPAQDIELNGSFVSYKCDPDAPRRSVTRVQPDAIRCNLGITSSHVPLEMYPVGDRIMGVKIYEIETRIGSSEATLKNITHKTLGSSEVSGVKLLDDGPHDGGTVVLVTDPLLAATATVVVDRPFHFSDDWHTGGTGVAYKYDANGDRTATALKLGQHDATTDASIIVQSPLDGPDRESTGVWLKPTRADDAMTYHKRCCYKPSSTRSRPWSDGILVDEIEVRAGYETTLLYVLDATQIEVEMRTFRGVSAAEMSKAIVALKANKQLEAFPDTPYGRTASLMNVLQPTNETTRCLVSTVTGGQFLMGAVMVDGLPHHFDYRSGTLGFSMVGLEDKKGLMYAQSDIAYTTTSGRTRTPAGDPVYGVIQAMQQDGLLRPEIAMVGPLDDSWVQIESGPGTHGLDKDTHDFKLLLESHSVAEEIVRNQLNPELWRCVVEADKSHLLGLTTQAALYSDPQGLHDDFASRGAWIRAVIELATSATVAENYANRL